MPSLYFRVLHGKQAKENFDNDTFKRRLLIGLEVKRPQHVECLIAVIDEVKTD